MPLNTSGPISLAGSTAGQSIALELGNTATTTTSMNDADVRDLAGVASGAITMPTDFYGASSGPTLSYGTAVDFSTSTVYKPSLAYNKLRDKVLVTYGDSNNNSYPTTRAGTVSGTSISWGTATVIWSGNSSPVYETASVYMEGSSANQRTAVFIKEQSSSGRGLGLSLDVNSSGTVSRQNSYVFESGEITMYSNAAFDDPDNSLAGIVYRDFNNSQYGQIAMVSTSSNYTPVVFHSSTTEDITAAYDTNSNKVLVCYTDSADSSKGKARVGTISSGGSVSFGTEVTYSTGSTFNNCAVFDSTNNKVVVLYETGNDLKAKVGTISGTSVSFGSEVTVDTNYITRFSLSASFDTTNGVVIAAWEDRQSSPNNGKAAIGTVSGTSISWSGLSTFEAGNVANTSCVYDPDTGKTIIAYRDIDSSDGTAIVATVVT